MASTRVPARFAFAMSVLDIAPHHRVLEFGCGNGVLAAQIAERVAHGQVTAIDRSASAVARSAANAAAVRFRHAELGGFATGSRFDRIVGVNVNLFWTGDCSRECAVLGSLLEPSGLVALVYETPGEVRPEIVERSVASLASAGFVVEVVRPPEPNMVAILARPGQRDQTS